MLKDVWKLFLAKELKHIRGFAQDIVRHRVCGLCNVFTKYEKDIRKCIKRNHL